MTPVTHGQPPHGMHSTLWSLPVGAVMLAQFLSALADNALLFVAIALVTQNGLGPAYVPLLQEFFVFAFIILAPFVGPLADSVPKGRVMLLANGMKFLGAGAMYAGLHPLLAYAMVGAGAAAYSPAKYGILGELVSPAHLVKANGMMEGSTIVAILTGVVLGGSLANHSIPLALLVVIGCYLGAAIINLFIPRLPPKHPIATLRAGAMLRDFWHAVKTLLRHPDARFSLLGTSLFWGSGSTLRLLLVAWVPVTLGATGTDIPALLNAVVAIGVAIGAGLAARFIPLQRYYRVLPAGILLGMLVCLLALLQELPTVVIVLVAIGACGGFFVVPLNAALQSCGHHTVGAGHAIAVQNFMENLAMLGMVGLYTALIAQGWPIATIAAGIGMFVTLGMLLLTAARVGKIR